MQANWVSQVEALLDHAASWGVLRQAQLAQSDIEFKSDQSPVTVVDRELSKILSDGLSAIDLDGLIVSEEAPQLRWSRKSSERRWLIDPIDATKDFIAGGDEWAIQVALFDGATPLGAWVWVPKKGLRLSTLAKGHSGQRNEPSKSESLVALKSQTRTDVWADRIYSGLGIVSFLKRSSIGYKAYSIALGEADLYLNSGGVCGVWDLGPCFLPLQNAQGMVLLVGPQPVSFEQFFTDEGRVLSPFALIGPRLMDRRDEIQKAILNTLG